MSDRLAQFGHNQAQAALAFGQTKTPFHFHTLTFVQKILRLASDFALLRPAQRGTGEPDAVLLAIDFCNRPGISVLDETGKLTNHVYDVFEIVKKHGAYLATGHINAKESIAVCNAGREAGVHMILTHPDWNRTIVPLNVQCDLARKGVFVEKVWFNVEGRDTTRQAASIQKIGAEHVPMVTDRGQFEQKLPPDAMTDFIESMIQEGISKTDIRKMVCDNPKVIVE